MHGRNCLRLLAGFFFLTGLLQGQSARPEGSSPRQVDHSASAVKPAAANGRALNDGDASATVVPPFLTARGSPLSPAPVPQPLPWRPPAFPVQSGLNYLVRVAGIIFSGTVTKVERISTDTAGQAGGTVSITFHVEKAIRGTRAGESLTISQWLGLWSSGQRYQVGQRVLLFLYPPSRIGLTSCLGAGMGRFAVDSAGNVWLSGQQILAFRTDPVLGGKSRVRVSDFASAVRSAGEEE